MTHLDNDDIRVATEAARKAIDASGYGHFVNDAKLQEVVVAILQELKDFHEGKTI